MENLKNAIVYNDNLFILSKIHEKHLLTLNKILQWLTNNNMKINLARGLQLTNNNNLQLYTSKKKISEDTDTN